MSGGVVVEARRGLEASQLDMAQLLGVHPMTVSKWERGIAEPSAYQLRQIRLMASEKNAGINALSFITQHGPALACAILVCRGAGVLS